MKLYNSEMTVQKWYGATVDIPRIDSSRFYSFASSCFGLAIAMMGKKANRQIHVGLSYDVETAYADPDKNLIVVSSRFMDGNFSAIGQTKRLNAQNTIGAILGVVTHEVGHFAYSPKDLRGYCDYVQSKTTKPFNLDVARRLSNVLEDIFMEYQIAKLVPNLGWSLDEINKLMLSDKLFSEVCKQAKEFTPDDSNLNQVLNFLLFAKVSDQPLRTGKYAKNLFSLARSVTTLERLSDRFALCLSLYDLIVPEKKASISSSKSGNSQSNQNDQDQNDDQDQTDQDSQDKSPSPDNDQNDPDQPDNDQDDQDDQDQNSGAADSNQDDQDQNDDSDDSDDDKNDDSSPSPDNDDDSDDDSDSDDSSPSTDDSDDDQNDDPDQDSDDDSDNPDQDSAADSDDPDQPDDVDDSDQPNDDQSDQSGQDQDNGLDYDDSDAIPQINSYDDSPTPVYSEISSQGNFKASLDGHTVVEISLPLSDSGIEMDTRWNKLAQATRQRTNANIGYGQQKTTGRNLRQLNRILTDQKVFSTRISQDTIKPIEVILLLDCSISMNENNGEKIRGATSAILGAVNGLLNGRAIVSAYGHTADRDNGTQTSNKEIVLYPLFTPGDSLSNLSRRLSTLRNVYGPKPTYTRYLWYSRDGYALYEISKKLQSKDKRQIIIIISDGEPSSGDSIYRRGYAQDHTKNMVDSLRKKGIDVFSISIDPKAFRPNNYIYGENFNVCSTDPNAIDTLIRQIYK